MSENNTKTCTKCNALLLATTDFFVKAKNGKHGLSAVCKSCQKQWRDARKDIKKEYDKKYTKENKEQIKKARKEYLKKNKEKIAEYNRNRNLDPNFIEYRRQYREKRKSRDSELFRKWRRENPERIATIKQRRHTRLKGLKSTLTHEEWEDCKKHFDYCCAYCGERKDLAREHFISVSEKGTFTKDNILPSCVNCNSSKNDRPFDKWYPNYKFYSKEREERILNYILSKKDGTDEYQT